ncbi:MAG: DedA family protein [Proteobacteria bacterium]|nr:DedA family protein [Pseudomonadota bacterium]
MEAFAHWVQGIVQSLGYPGLFVLIFLESTLVPIPSELVMPFAGFMASQGTFALPLVLVINSVGALLGSLTCYAIGAKLGKPFVVKYGKFAFIKAKDLEKTEEYFAKHGKLTILIGRFLPVVRHVISIPAGIARMPLRPFLLQTFIGSTIWGSFLILIGYYLGKNWETVAKQFKRVDLIVGVVLIAVAVAFAIRFILQRRRARAAAAAGGVSPTSSD